MGFVVAPSKKQNGAPYSDKQENRNSHRFQHASRAFILILKFRIQRHVMSLPLIINSIANSICSTKYFVPPIGARGSKWTPTPWHYPKPSLLIVTLQTKVWLKLSPSACNVTPMFVVKELQRGVFSLPLAIHPREKLLGSYDFVNCSGHTMIMTNFKYSHAGSPSVAPMTSLLALRIVYKPLL